MQLPNITIHGRFQPPLHVNHKNYVMDAFDRAQKVTILITNPDLEEGNVEEANHRNKKDNNPFTYEERIKIFKSYFDRIGIPESRYEFKPFDITDEDSWDKILDHNIPNLVNVYGEWSETKSRKFQEKGYRIIRTDNPKELQVSGSTIREILKSSGSEEEKKEKLISVGYMRAAVGGLFSVLKSR